MPAIKLTDTQLVILSAASQREDRGVILPTKLKGGAAQKLVAKMIDLGLIEEVRARSDLPVWRRDADNRAMALRITRCGLKAIAVEDDPGDQQGSEDEPATLKIAVTVVAAADAKGRRATARSDKDAGKIPLPPRPASRAREFAAARCLTVALSSHQFIGAVTHAAGTLTWFASVPFVEGPMCRCSGLRCV